MADALTGWRDALGAWAIPREILEKAPESPWTLPPDVFAQRGGDAGARREMLSIRRAAEALQPAGSVLDVGAGGGGSSLALREQMTELVAVDSDPAMPARLRETAAANGVPLTVIEGRWPDVAGRTPVCDVAVCGHVLYNVPDLAPFITALSAHARRRVVLEISAAHPMARLTPLWRRFWGIDRPDGPTWEDAVQAVSACGVTPQVEHDVQRGPGPRPSDFDALVAWQRRRLCLTADRDPEVADALRELGVERERPETWSMRPAELVVLWWDVPPVQS